MDGKNVSRPAASLTSFSRLVVNALFQRNTAWLFESGKELFAIRRGSRVVVKSRTRAGVYHVVDLEKQTCTCEGFRYNKKCWHLEAADYAEVADNV